MEIFGTFFVALVVGFITACIFLFHYKEKADTRKHQLMSMSTSVTKAQRERREMLDLLRNIYDDLDKTDGSLYHDTIRKLENTVKK